MLRRACGRQAKAIIPSVRPPARQTAVGLAGRAGKIVREGEGKKGCVRKSSVVMQLNCESTI